MDILVLPGDHIGPEITEATLTALAALDRRFALGLECREEAIGLASLARHGTTMRPEILERARAADGVILGPMSTFDYPPPAEGGINPSSAFRVGLELYANMRPSYVRRGVGAPAKAMDLVVMRENLEGFYADRNMFAGTGEFMPSPDIAIAVGKLSRIGAERIAVAGFELARRRRAHVTVVHKANALRMFYGFFLDCVREVAGRYADVAYDELIIDAMTAHLIRTPERFDVVVTTNMFGDILSDEAAELAGGLGLASSLNHGDRHAVAQAAHGSAPDIAGQDRANPTALLHSVALLLEHLGARRRDNALAEAARCLTGAVDRLLAEPASRTPDLGGALGTQAFGRAVAAQIERD